MGYRARSLRIVNPVAAYLICLAECASYLDDAFTISF